MKKCTELLRNAGRSLVEIRETDTDKVEKYVVCSNFDNSKKYGSKWDWGTYFNVFDGISAESQMRLATLYLYDIDESEISVNRLKELSKIFITELREYMDNDTEFVNILKNSEIRESEAEFFGIKDILFAKKYKVVRVTLTRTQEVDINVVMPTEVDEYNVEDYIENTELIEDGYYYNIESQDWEVDSYDMKYDDMSKEELESQYDMEDIWNSCDIDNM